MSRPRVAIDVTPLIGPLTGVGRYVRGVLPHLLADDSVEIMGWVVSARGGSVAAPPDLTIRTVRLPARAVHRLWAAGFAGTGRIIGRHDVVHGTNFAAPPGSRSVITVHDLTPLESSGLPPALRGRADLIRRAAADGAHMVVPSDHVRDRLITAVDADPELVTAIPHGIDPIPQTADGAGRARVGADRYVLALGSVNRRKNLVRLVEASAALPPDVGLVIAGSPGDDEDRVAEALGRVAAHRVARRLAEVDDDARAALLRDATVLAYPSLDEGFGFPPLEAMSVDVPVVAAAAGAIPEIVGDGALLVEPTDTEAIAAALGEALEGDGREALVDRGRRVAARHQWSVATSSLLAVYLRTAAGSR